MGDHICHEGSVSQHQTVSTFTHYITCFDSRPSESDDHRPVLSYNIVLDSPMRKANRLNRPSLPSIVGRCLPSSIPPPFNPIILRRRATGAVGRILGGEELMGHR